MASADAQMYDQFVCLLRDSLNSDNNIRKNSEARLKDIDSETKIKLLLCVIMRPNADEVVEMASVLLRRMLDQFSNHQKINPQTLAFLKENLFQICLSQQNKNLRTKIIYVISSLVSISMGKNNVSFWPESCKFFYDCLTQPSVPFGCEIALRLVDSSPCIMAQFSKDVMPGFYGKIIELFASYNSGNDEMVKLAVKAFTSVLIDRNSDGMLARINEALNNFFGILVRCDSDMAVALLQELNVIIDCKARSLRNHVVVFIQTILELLHKPASSLSVRFEALECIASFAEHAPKTFKKKAEGAIPSLVCIFMKHMSIIQEDENWAFANSDDISPDDEDISTSAETCLDRFTCAIGGKTMLPIILSEVSPLLQNDAWKLRYTALVTISCIAEGCIKQLKPMLPKVVELVVPYIKDKHPRVVYACINAIGQLAVDYIGHFHQTYHQQAFPAILFAAENYGEVPRVQAHAVCCFVNLIDGCPLGVMSQYSDKFFLLLSGLFVISVNSINKPGVSLILENVLISLAKLADAIGSMFVKYYSGIAPNLIVLVRTFSQTDHIKFFVSGLETLSTILLSVGSDICRNELQSVLAIVKDFDINKTKMKSKTDSNDYLLEYLEILSKIAQVLRGNFAPILPTFMSMLVGIVSAPVENAFMPYGTASSTDENSDGFKTMTTAHTDSLNDKYRACIILHSLCESMKTDLSDSVEQIFGAMVKNLRECWDEEIQTAACDMFPLLLKCSQNKGGAYVAQLWSQIVYTLHHLVMMDTDGYFCRDSAYDSIKECVDVVGIPGLNQDILTKITSLMIHEITRMAKDAEESEDTNNKSCAEQYDENYEDEEYDADSDEDSECVINAIHDLHNHLFKILGDDFLPYFRQLAPAIKSLLECPNNELKYWSIYFIDDIIEFSCQNSVGFTPMFLPTITKLITDKDSQVRQASCYCVGLMAQHGAALYHEQILQCLPLIISTITDPKSRTDEHCCATANAIAVVGRIMKYCPSCVAPFDLAVKSWVDWLPVIDDEVDFILGYLLELIETNFQMVIGHNNSNLFKVLDSMATMISYAETETSKACLDTLSKFNQYDAGSFNAWYSKLDSEKKDNLNTVRDSLGLDR